MIRAMSVGLLPRGARNLDRERSQQPGRPSGGVGSRPQRPCGVGGAEAAAFVCGFLEPAPAAAAVGAGGEALARVAARRWLAPLCPSAGGGCCLGCGDRGSVQRASVHGLSRPPRVAAWPGRSRRRPAAANLPARLERGSEAPGTTSGPAEMTRGLLPPKISLRSPRVRGACSKSPPPARWRGPAPRADSRRALGVCACAGRRRLEPDVCLTARQVWAAHRVTFPPGVRRRVDARGGWERLRLGWRSSLGSSVSQSTVSQSV